MRNFSVIFARSINQYKFKYQKVISARFEKQDEINQTDDEAELFTNLNINHHSTEIDIAIIDIKSQLEHQIQTQETKKSGWRFDKIKSMTVSFYKTGEMNVSNFIKIPLRSSAILNIQKCDKNCFLWS